MSCFSYTSSTVVGNITQIKARTDLHATSSVRDIVSFRVSSSLIAPCKWLYFSQSNHGALSVLLSAKARGEEVEVVYYSDVRAEFNASHCATAFIQE